MKQLHILTDYGTFRYVIEKETDKTYEIETKTIMEGYDLMFDKELQCVFAKVDGEWQIYLSRDEIYQADVKEVY